MTTQSDAPADTRMMGIVHQALRRDLGRAQAALTNRPPPSPRRQRAIAGHLMWMMSFLRDHHRSEDEGLYPLVRRRDPAAAALLDTMNADHDTVAPAITRVEEAARTFRSQATGAETSKLIEALDNLQQVLLPHLRREEEGMMPVVSAAITDAEWRALEREHNLKPKSFIELGREGHWLIDDASPQDRQAVVGLVPVIPRFVLLHGFARSYRRRTSACWGAPPRPRRRVQKSGRCEVQADADVDAVWHIVCDVSRIGEWSHECVGATWLGGATSAMPGARFRGHNRQGLFRWSRACEIVTADPYQLVWRTIATALYPDSTEWTIHLYRSSRGTRIEQTFKVLRAPKALDMLFGLVIPAHQDRIAALTEDLRRLGQLARSADRADVA